MAIWYPGFGHP